MEEIIWGKKGEMGQTFDQNGKRIPITEIKIETKNFDLKPGDLVKITGISKGKGFAGVMKRWGFKGGPRTHGQSDRQRAPGSIGQRTDPGRVWKGKKMPGHLGNKKVTIKNLKIVSVDKEKQILTVSGPIPGSKNGRIAIRKIASLNNQTK